MGCVTLLSDFGLQDASLAAAKGRLMKYLPGIQMVDISHDVSAFHLQQAAFLLMASFRHFPPGTCHLLYMDIFSEAKPRLLLCAYEGHYFLAPDNGLLSLALGEDIKDVWQCYEMEHMTPFSDWVEKTGAIAADLQEKNPADLGYPSCTIKVAPRHWQPNFDGNSAECHVIHIDRYENVVLNITRKQFEDFAQGRNFTIQLLRDEAISHISTHFNDVGGGQMLCRFNAAGFLEIAVNRGSAAKLFGLKMYSEKQMMYNHIRIHFE